MREVVLAESDRRCLRTLCNRVLAFPTTIPFTGCLFIERPLHLIYLFFSAAREPLNDKSPHGSAPLKNNEEDSVSRVFKQGMVDTRLPSWNDFDT